MILIAVFTNYKIKPKIKQYKDEAKILIEESTVDTFKINNSQTILSYEEIPENVKNAFVSVEDRRFWKNNGIDVIGIAAAIYEKVFEGQPLRGASTITQQVAKNIFLSNERTFTRKVKEYFIARELTKKYSKEEILTFYINTCYFANGAYGIEDASIKYFGKNSKDLTLAETTYLCSLPNRPSYFDPFKDIEKAKPRQRKILKDMLRDNKITKEDLQNALKEEIKIINKEKENEFLQ